MIIIHSIFNLIDSTKMKQLICSLYISLMYFFICSQHCVLSLLSVCLFFSPSLLLLLLRLVLFGGDFGLRFGLRFACS